MDDRPRRNFVLLVLACALPLLLVAACIAYPQIQYARNVHTLTEFAKQIGFTELERLTEPYRRCEAGIPQPCALYVNYHTSKHYEQLNQELHRVGKSFDFNPGGLTDGSSVSIYIAGGNRSDPSKWLKVNGKVPSTFESTDLFPTGNSASVVDANNNEFYLAWFPLGASNNTYTLENTTITDNVVTIVLNE